MVDERPKRETVNDRTESDANHGTDLSRPVDRVMRFHFFLPDFSDGDWKEILEMSTPVNVAGERLSRREIAKLLQAAFLRLPKAARHSAPSAPAATEPMRMPIFT